jgi:hypothetical protein
MNPVMPSIYSARDKTSPGAGPTGTVLRKGELNLSCWRREPEALR